MEGSREGGASGKPLYKLWARSSSKVTDPQYRLGVGPVYKESAFHTSNRYNWRGSVALSRSAKTTSMARGVFDHSNDCAI